MWVSGEALSEMQRDIIRLNDELEKNKRISHELITGLIEKVLFDPETLKKEIQSTKELDREIHKIITEETEGEGDSEKILIDNIKIKLMNPVEQEPIEIMRWLKDNGLRNSRIEWEITFE